MAKYSGRYPRKAWNEKVVAKLPPDCTNAQAQALLAKWARIVREAKHEGIPVTQVGGVALRELGDGTIAVVAGRHNK